MAAHHEMQLCLLITSNCCPATLQPSTLPTSPAAAAASMDSAHIGRVLKVWRELCEESKPEFDFRVSCWKYWARELT